MNLHSDITVDLVVQLWCRHNYCKTLCHIVRFVCLGLGLGLCCLMTPGLSKDSRCHV